MRHSLLIAHLRYHQKPWPNKALHRNSRCPRPLSLLGLFNVSFPLHHYRHRLWVSLDR
jgi:hypothetical protein